MSASECASDVNQQSSSEPMERREGGIGRDRDKAVSVSLSPEGEMFSEM